MRACPRRPENARAGFCRPAGILTQRLSPAARHLAHALCCCNLYRAAGSGVPAFRQHPVEVLASVEHPENGDDPRDLVHGVGDHGASLVVGNAQAWSDVFARYAPKRKECQAFASLDHRAGVARGDGR